MHIVRVDNQYVKLDTAVFLEEDIRKVSQLAYSMGYGLGNQLVKLGSKLNETSSEIKNFLGGVVGVQQGISKLLKEKNLIINWKDYGGRYESTKVDFDELCEIYLNLPQDYQTKSVLKGVEYTAVFIGINGETFEGLLNPMFLDNPTHAQELLEYLTDSLAKFLLGNNEHSTLKKMAQDVNFYKDHQLRKLVITPELYDEFKMVVKEISEASYQYYVEHLNDIITCLNFTSSGKQGVSPENMMMHFWRYCRRTLAKSLYDSGFFTDDIVENGAITVFYDNNIIDLVNMFK